MATDTEQYPIVITSAGELSGSIYVVDGDNGSDQLRLDLPKLDQLFKLPSVDSLPATALVSVSQYSDGNNTIQISCGDVPWASLSQISSSQAISVASNTNDACLIILDGRTYSEFKYAAWDVDFAFQHSEQVSRYLFAWQSTTDNLVHISSSIQDSDNDNVADLTIDLLTLPAGIEIANIDLADFSFISTFDDDIAGQPDDNSLSGADSLKLYQYTVGIFDAAPGGYLNNLASYASNNSLSELVTFFAQSDAFHSLHENYAVGASDADFVNEFFTHLLGSGVDNTTMDTVKNWAQQYIVENSRAKMMQYSIDFLSGQDEQDEQFGASAALFNTHVTRAQQYSSTDTDSLSTELDMLHHLIYLNKIDVNFADNLNLTEGIDEVNLDVSGQLSDFISPYKVHSSVVAVTVNNFVFGEDILCVNLGSTVEWSANSSIAQSTGAHGEGSDVRLVVLDNEPIGDLKNAEDTADGYQESSTQDAYLFAWDSSTDNSVHITAALPTESKDKVLDLFVLPDADLADLANLSLSSFIFANEDATNSDTSNDDDVDGLIVFDLGTLNDQFKTYIALTDGNVQSQQKLEHLSALAADPGTSFIEITAGNNMWAAVNQVHQSTAGDDAISARLIVLDESEYDHFTYAASDADKLQHSEAEVSYLFAWQSNDHVVHLSAALQDPEDNGKDNVLDLLTVAHAEIADIDLTDFHFLGAAQSQVPEQTITALNSNQITAGNIAIIGEQDKYAFHMEFGNDYKFNLESDAIDPSFELRNSDNKLLLSATEEKSTAAKFTYTPQDDGDFFIYVSDDGGDEKGDYKLSALAYDNFLPTYSDDYGDGVDSAGILSVGDSTEARLEIGNYFHPTGDVDWFKLQGLTVGEQYTLNMRSTDLNSFLTLYAADGSEITHNDNTSYRVDSHLIFTAQEEMYVAASAKGDSGHGGYNMSLVAGEHAEPSIQDDDYGQLLSTAGTLAVNSYKNANIDFLEDQDWFKTSTLTTGVTYKFYLDSDNVDMQVAILNADGNQIASNDNPSTNDVKITFVPEDDGIYYVVAESAGSVTDYSLSSYQITLGEYA